MMYGPAHAYIWLSGFHLGSFRVFSKSFLFVGQFVQRGAVCSCHPCDYRRSISKGAVPDYLHFLRKKTLLVLFGVDAVAWFCLVLSWVFFNPAVWLWCNIASTYESTH